MILWCAALLRILVVVKLLARSVAFDSDSGSLCVLEEPSSFRDEAAYGPSLNSRAVLSSCGVWSGQREIFSRSNRHFYSDVGSSHGSCDGAAQTECDAHLHDRPCDPYPGVGKQLKFVSCVAAAGDRSSNNHLTCVDCRSLSGRTSCSGSCNAGAVAVRAENKADTYAGTFRSPATSTHSSAAFGNFGRIGASVAAALVAGGWTSSSGSCNAGAVAVRAENKADTYAGTSRSPATSTHSLSEIISFVGNFGRIGTRVAV
jgi:hypothetical protein